MSRAVVLLTLTCVLACGAGVATAATEPATTAPTAGNPSGGITYGISDATGNYARCAPQLTDCCDPSRPLCDLAGLIGSYDDPYFRMLTTPASAHRVRQIRLFVQYDAVQEWNGSTVAPGCVYSRALHDAWIDAADRYHEAGESWRDLLAGVREARAQGLEPIVSIAGYASPDATPSWDQPFPDPTTVGGYWNYRCGVQGVLGALSRLPAWQQPHVWETVNEPDGFGVFTGPPTPLTPPATTQAQAATCAVGATAQLDGPAKAACVYVLGSTIIRGYAGHARDTVLAGVFTHPSVAYLAGYVAGLRRDLPAGALPPDWSVHDYGDVTSAYSGSDSGSDLLGAFDAALGSDTGGAARDLWVTESGTLLTDRTADPDCASGQTSVDGSGTLGACVDGDPARQSASAAAFFALPMQAGSVPITHLFWYEWRSAEHWDSGLVDAAGQPRPAWCVFYGTTGCNGSPWAS